MLAVGLAGWHASGLRQLGCEPRPRSTTALAEPGWLSALGRRRGRLPTSGLRGWLALLLARLLPLLLAWLLSYRRTCYRERN